MTTNAITEAVSQAITEALGPIISENEELRETLTDVRTMFDAENRGWQLLLGLNAGESAYGLDLDDVKAIAEKAATQVAAGALPKRAADLHFGFVFGNGMEIEGVERERGKKGRPGGVISFYESSVNQESIFSGAAKHELQYARFVTGNVIVLCDTVKKEVRRLPLAEVKSVMTNPDFPEEIWAYLREWSHYLSSGETETRQAWVYTNRFPERRQRTIRVGNDDIPVMQNITAVDLRANKQVGFTFGVPDAAAGLHWSTAYGEVLRYGQIVNESLAKVVYKVVQKSGKGAQNVGVKMGRGGSGQTAVVGEGQDIQLVNQSQSSFNFAAARPLAAMAATAWNVSVVDLLSDSSAAGSSYGAGNLLTAGMQNAMNGMRDEWRQFYSDVFEVMGFDRPRISFPPMEKPDTYRMAQELTLYSIALTDEEYRAAVLDRLDITGDATKIPPMLKARGEVPKQAASPGQGQSNGTGGQDSGQRNDLRDDTVGENLRHEMAIADQLAEMRSLIEELRSVKGM